MEFCESAKVGKLCTNGKLWDFSMSNVSLWNLQPCDIFGALRYVLLRKLYQLHGFVMILFSVFDTVERYAPGFKQSIVGTDILTPPDLEEVFNLTGGVSYN